MNNRDFIGKYLPYLVDVFTKQDRYKIDVSSEGFNVKYKGNYIQYHSQRYFEKEMDLITSNIKASDEVLILFGIGNGRSLEHILTKYTHLKRLIIIEPSVNIFVKSLDYFQMLDLTTHDCDITFLVDYPEEKIYEVIGLAMVEHNLKVSICKQAIFSLIFKDYYNSLTVKIADILRQSRISYVTHDFWRNKWIENIVTNYLLHDDKIITKEDSIFRDKRVFIVGAGPSLDNDIEKLRKHQDKGIILGVGTGNRILNENGIEADYRIAIDAIQTMKNLDKSGHSQIPLIYSNMVNSELIMEYKGPKYEIVLSTDSMTKFFYNDLDVDFLQVRSSYSVAQVAIDMCAKLGAKEIILLGLDCAYTNDRLHAKNDGEEEIEAHTVNIDFEKKADSIRTYDKHGQLINTDIVLFSMKTQTETLVREFNEIAFLNATSQGLHIDGTRDIDLLDYFENPTFIDQCLNKEGSDLKVNPPMDKLRFISYFKEFKELFEDKLDGIRQYHKMGQTEELSINLLMFIQVLEENEFFQNLIKPFSRYSRHMLVYGTHKDNVDVDKSLSQLTMIGEYLYLIDSIIEFHSKNSGINE